ncbi:hypothetical protein [Rhodanobacter sp. MP7CTX1]|uniref:hypothetical protein n=1 Tax=Rhodanobacter sp. MP7CTX1 TaxID=2723084 RepID=UPI00160E1CAB|nr:hypothetical protein [Rhodanobacter sp. MP7CTX1]MBB6186651.1 hypothetical protein [Rhodanobacter sp. MP7CTX1]
MGAVTIAVVDASPARLQEMALDRLILRTPRKWKDTRWVSPTLDDDDLDSFVDALLRRLASFDRETLVAAKAWINQFWTRTAAEL